MAVGVLLLLVGFLFWMQRSLRPVLARLHGEQVVTAYLEAGVPEKEEDAVVDAIRTTLGAHATTDHKDPEVKLVRAGDFVEQLKGPYPELSRELEDFGPEMKTLVPRYVSVAGMLKDTALEQIKGVKGIESAESSKNRYKHIVGAFSALRWVARLLMLGLFIALLTGLIHLSRMNAYLHSDALAVLKLWGAGQGVLNVPGVISGFLVGLLGGWIALIGWLTGGSWLAGHIRALSLMLRDMPHAGSKVGIALLVTGSLLGILAGGLGGVFARARVEGRG